MARKVQNGLLRFLGIVKYLQQPLHRSDLASVKKKSNSRFTAYFYDMRRIPVARVVDCPVDAATGSFSIRLYHPDPGRRVPVIVFYHGGGFVVGGVKSYDHFCRRLTRATGYAVASVDYRLAPEHKYPSAHQDAWEAVCWLRKEQGRWELDTERLVLAGDSAGGNLAASVAFRARDQGVKIAKQVLIYPVLDMTRKKQSAKDNFLLSDKDLEWFTRHLVQNRQDLCDPVLSVSLHQDLHGLPNTLFIQAEYDHLNSEIEEFGARLKNSGVGVQIHQEKGTFHGYITMKNWYDPQSDPFPLIIDFLHN